jgi:glucose-1-phosphate thymidylyltransferase
LKLVISIDVLPDTCSNLATCALFFLSADRENLLLHNHQNERTETTREIIALIPAAGRGTRLPDVPGSKELVEVSLRPGQTPAPVIDFLLTALATSGASATRVITRAEKTDLREHVANRRSSAHDIEAVLTKPTASVVHTLLSVLLASNDKDIALAFPDIIFRPGDTLGQLLTLWGMGAQDVLLAGLPTDRADKSDLIELSADGQLERIHVKDPNRDSGWSWIMAVWNPRFSEFLVEWAAAQLIDEHELQLGNAMNEALVAGLSIKVHCFPDGRFLDIGTPDDLARLQHEGL